MTSSDKTIPPLHSVTLTQHPDGSACPSAHTIVILHGWGKNLEVLRPLGELLVTNDTKVVLIDLPGFGLSPLPFGASNEGGGWGTEEYGDIVEGHLSELGITKCTLIGHSFGGRVSVRLAARYPELISGLILIASHGIPRDRSATESLKIDCIRKLSHLSKWLDRVFRLDTFTTKFSPRFGSLDYRLAGDLRKTLVKTVNENLSYEAQSIRTPTLLLWGKNDSETPISIARKFNSLIKGSLLHILPNKGHEPYSDVGAHLLAKYVHDFLSSKILPKVGA